MIKQFNFAWAHQYPFPDCYGLFSPLTHPVDHLFHDGKIVRGMVRFSWFSHSTTLLITPRSIQEARKSFTDIKEVPGMTLFIRGTSAFTYE
jgi:hypothetical protein